MIPKEDLDEIMARGVSLMKQAVYLSLGSISAAARADKSQLPKGAKDPMTEAVEDSARLLESTNRLVISDIVLSVRQLSRPEPISQESPK